MKIKNIFPLFALIIGLGIVVSQSAFTSKASKISTTETFFQYIPTSYSPSEYIDADNWVVTEDLTECPGNGNVCKLKVADADLTGAGSPEEQLARFLEHRVDGPADYVEDSNNMIATKN